MPSDPKRIEQVHRAIHRLRSDYYCGFARPLHRVDRPYLGIDRPWNELPPAAQLVLLQQIDWSGVAGQDQVRILLAEIKDPARLSDGQRRHLHDLAKATEPPPPKPDIFER